MTTLNRLAAAALLGAAGNAGAQVRREAPPRPSDWIGEWSVVLDQQARGQLRIREIPADCASPAWCALRVAYIDEAGAHHAAAVTYMTGRPNRNSRGYIEIVVRFRTGQRPAELKLVGHLSLDGQSIRGRSEAPGQQSSPFMATRAQPGGRERPPPPPRGDTSGTTGGNFPPGGAVTDSAHAVSRAILPGGTVEIRYSDGAVKRIRPMRGGRPQVITVLPNGQADTIPGTITSQVGFNLPPLTDAPSPREPGLKEWLVRQQSDLEKYITLLVGNDSQSLGELRALERGKDPYDIVRLRLDALGFLLTSRQ